jgi:hypothetical protein
MAREEYVEKRLAELQQMSEEDLSNVLLRSDTPPEVRDYVLQHRKKQPGNLPGSPEKTSANGNSAGNKPYRDSKPLSAKELKTFITESLSDAADH